ncbi:MAG: ACP S-malonyltransferase [Acidimicrobiia bacterium]
MTIAFIFPGQGAQKPGMGAPWTDHGSWEIVEGLSAASGRDVAALLVDAGADELTQTRNSQLATYSISLVVLDAVRQMGALPAAVAGHSLGEYTALTAAGAVTVGDCARLVTERGEAMQQAASERTGTMAAVLGLDDDDVETACNRAAGDVWPANFNAPGNVVIAGDPAAIAAAGAVAKDMGASKVLPVKVSGAFHTPFMAPARDRLRKALDDVDFAAAQVPLVANVDATAHTGPDWSTQLLAQLCTPVRWRQSLHTLADLGVTAFVEIGPGSVLTGTVKRTIDGAAHLSVSTPADLDALRDLLDGDPPAPARSFEGEHLSMSERVVVSPSAGLFEPSPELAPGLAIETGDVIGKVAGTEVRSPFAGRIEGVLAHLGERLLPRQPVAWLRVRTA